MTVTEALHARQPFEFGQWGAFLWPDGGAYEVVVGGRMVAFEFPGLQPVFNEAHPAAEQVKQAMVEGPTRLTLVA